MARACEWPKIRYHDTWQVQQLTRATEQQCRLMHACTAILQSELAYSPIGHDWNYLQVLGCSCNSEMATGQSLVALLPGQSCPTGKPRALQLWFHFATRCWSTPSLMIRLKNGHASTRRACKICCLLMEPKWQITHLPTSQCLPLKVIHWLHLRGSSCLTLIQIWIIVTSWEELLIVSHYHTQKNWNESYRNITSDKR